MVGKQQDIDMDDSLYYAKMYMRQLEAKIMRTVEEEADKIVDAYNNKARKVLEKIHAA